MKRGECVTLVFFVSLMVLGSSIRGIGLAMAGEGVYISSKESIAIQEKVKEIQNTLEVLTKRGTDVNLTRKEARLILEGVAEIEYLVTPISSRLEMLKEEERKEREASEGLFKRLLKKIKEAESKR